MGLHGGARIAKQTKQSGLAAFRELLLGNRCFSLTFRHIDSCVHSRKNAWSEREDSHKCVSVAAWGVLSTMIVVQVDEFLNKSQKSMKSRRLVLCTHLPHQPRDRATLLVINDMLLCGQLSVQPCYCQPFTPLCGPKHKWVQEHERLPRT